MTVSLDFNLPQAEVEIRLRNVKNTTTGRFVFYAVVQAGGFILVSSPLGQAFQQSAGSAVPVFTNEKDGSRSFFAGDLYFWWETHKSEYSSFPLYDEWRQRDFTRNVAIKMYEQVRQESEMKALRRTAVESGPMKKSSGTA